MNDHNGNLIKDILLIALGNFYARSFSPEMSWFKERRKKLCVLVILFPTYANSLECSFKAELIVTSSSQCWPNCSNEVMVFKHIWTTVDHWIMAFNIITLTQLQTHCKHVMWGHEVFNVLQSSFVLPLQSCPYMVGVLNKEISHFDWWATPGV